MCKTNKSKFLAGWIKGIILSTQLLSFLKLRLIDKLLLKHVGLPHILDLAVHLVNFFGWMSLWGHSEPLLLFALFYQSTPSCLKVRGVWVGGVVAHVILVSAQVLLVLTLGLLTSDLGLTISMISESCKNSVGGVPVEQENSCLSSCYISSPPLPQL